MEAKQIPGLLMLIDFEKAFDSLLWEFLYAVLKCFNFGSNFVRWITVFNTNIKAYVIQSGFYLTLLTLNLAVTKGIQ